MLHASVTQCSYCGAATALAQRLAQEAHAQQQQFAYQQHQLHLQQQVARQQEAQDSIKRTALHSLVWSALGLICCLVPVFGVVGVVMALRARKMAHKYGLVVPATATLGLVTGVFSLLASVGVYVAITVQELNRADRIEKLERQLAQGAQARELSLQVACDLAQLRLLKDGIAGKSGSSLDDFECTGKLRAEAESATLNDYSFRADSDSRHHVKVCYRRGARWTVTAFRQQAECHETEDLARVLFVKSNATQVSSGEVEPSSAHSE